MIPKFCVMIVSFLPHSECPPGSSVHGILQARILEWIAIPFCRGSSQPRDRTEVSCLAGRRFTLWATREANWISKLRHIQTMHYGAPESSCIWSRVDRISRSFYEVKWSRSVMSDSLQPHRLLHPWDFPGKNTGVGCHFLLQGNFLTQGWNPGLLHCMQTPYRWATGEAQNLL